MLFLTIFFIDEILKNLIFIQNFVIFFLEESVHNCERRETKNCLNDLNDNTLERQGLGAYFEPYNSIISWVITFRRFVKMMEYRIFF